MHHTITDLSSNRFLIFGGRTSPAKPCTTTHILTPRCRMPTAQLSIPSTHCTARRTPLPLPGGGIQLKQSEWAGGRWSIVSVFGGRGVDAHPMGDCWLLDVEKECWERVRVWTFLVFSFGLDLWEISIFRGYALFLHLLPLSKQRQFLHI